MSFLSMLGAESKSEYVGRKVKTFRKEYVWERAFDRVEVDQTELDYLTRQIRAGAEDSYDRWSL